MAELIDVLLAYAVGRSDANLVPYEVRGNGNGTGYVPTGVVRTCSHQPGYEPSRKAHVEAVNGQNQTVKVLMPFLKRKGCPWGGTDAEPSIELNHETEDWYMYYATTTPQAEDLEASTGALSIGTSPRRRGNAPQRKQSDHHQEVVAKLVDAGMLPEAAEQLMQTRWSEGGAKNLAAAWKQWSQHCEIMLHKGYVVDRMDPTPIELVNFLRAIRKGEYRSGAKKGEQVSGGWVRGMRSAISTTVALWTRHSSIGSHPVVSGYVTAILNEDFNTLKKRGYKYDDTWETEPFYDEMRKRNIKMFQLNAKMPTFRNMVNALRDVMLGVTRLALACRSHDLTCVFRGLRSDHDRVRFWLADDVDCPYQNRRSGLKSIGGEPLEPNGTPQGPYGVRGVAVRYFGPKQRHSLAVRSHGYTDWITVDAIADSRICVAQLMYLYIRASELLPAGVQGDALFLSHTARKDRDDKFYAMKPASLATAMQRMMIAAGIPVEFTAHSARHAGMAAGKASGMNDDELCARSNMSSATYKKYYQRQVRHKVAEPSAGVNLGACAG